MGIEINVLSNTIYNALNIYFYKILSITYLHVFIYHEFQQKKFVRNERTANFWNISVLES